MVTGISTFWLPETFNAKMHQTIEEEENAPENYTFPCCSKQKAIEVTIEDHTTQS